MSSKTPNEDILYEQQMLEVTELGNALLAGITTDKISENKRRIISKMQNIGDLNSYKRAVEELRSLKIANIHMILKINEENDQSIQIQAAEKLLMKIEEILCAHVKYNAKDVISNDELEALKNHMNLLQALRDNIKYIPTTADSKLKKVESFTRDLSQIVNYIESTSIKLDECQNSIIKDASDVMSYT